MPYKKTHNLMLEQRLTYRLIQYWERLRRDQPLPVIEWFNPAVVQDLWPQCLKLTVFSMKDAYSYHYEYVGEALITMFGKNLSGERISSSMIHSPGFNILAKLDHVIQHPTPAIEEGQFINNHSKIVKYRCCLLPFGPNITQITHCIIGISWRAY